MKKKIFFVLLMSILGAEVAFSQGKTLIIKETPQVMTSETIKDYDFASVEILIIPDGVKEIGRDTFYGFEFTEVRLPDSLKRIGENAFGNCESLKSVNIPGYVEEIAVAAFSGCGELSKVNFGRRNGFGSSLRRIGEYAFMDCESLKIIDLSFAVDGLEIDYGAFLRSGLTEIKLPAGLIKLGANCLASTVLERVYYPDDRNFWERRKTYYNFSLEEQFYEAVSNIDEVDEVELIFDE